MMPKYLRYLIYEICDLLYYINCEACAVLVMSGIVAWKINRWKLNIWKLDQWKSQNRNMCSFKWLFSKNDVLLLILAHISWRSRLEITRTEDFCQRWSQRSAKLPSNFGNFRKIVSKHGRFCTVLLMYYRESWIWNRKGALPTLE